MPPFLITELARKEYLIPFGILAREAEEAYKQADQRHAIRDPEGNVILTLYLKRRPHPRPARSLLVVAQHHEDTEQIVQVYKIYDDLCGDLVAATPLDILRLIAEKYGFDVAVGEQRARFILGESIPLGDRVPKQVVRVIGAGSRDFKLSAMVRTTANPTPTAECFLVMALDTNRYRTWIQKREKKKR